MAVWNVEILKKLLKPGYSAWDFEMKGSMERFKLNTLFLGVKEEMFVYYNGIIRGNWVSSSLERLIMDGISVDLTQRNVLNYSTRNTPSFQESFHDKIKNFIYLYLIAKFRNYKYRYKIKLKKVI